MTLDLKYITALRALKRWTPSPATLWRILFPDTPNSGPGGTRAGW
jgi:hypothetical protein